MHGESFYGRPEMLFEHPIPQFYQTTQIKKTCLVGLIELHFSNWIELDMALPKSQSGLCNPTSLMWVSKDEDEDEGEVQCLSFFCFDFAFAFFSSSLLNYPC